MYMFKFIKRVNVNSSYNKKSGKYIPDFYVQLKLNFTN